MGGWRQLLTLQQIRIAGTVCWELALLENLSSRWCILTSELVEVFGVLRGILPNQMGFCRACWNQAKVGCLKRGGTLSCLEDNILRPRSSATTRIGPNSETIFCSRRQVVKLNKSGTNSVSKSLIGRITIEWEQFIFIFWYISVCVLES